MADPDEPHESLAAHAREILDATRYLTLSTVGLSGRPWTTPVYFAWTDPWEFYWVSAADALHSHNLNAHPAVSFTVFDSTVPAYHGRAVYAVGDAAVVAEDALDRALAAYPGPPERGGAMLTREEVSGDSRWRFYRATAAELWVLCPGEPGQGCSLHGITQDHRARVK